MGQDRMNALMLLFVHKDMKMDTSHVIDMSSRSEVSSRATSASVLEDLCVPLGRTCVSRNTVALAGAIIWNNLSEQVRRCQTLQAFKRGLH